MYRSTLLFLLYGCLSSCASNVKFGKSQHFNLGKNEKELAITAEMVSHYEKRFDSELGNVPLNKVIANDTLNYFIGVILEGDCTQYLKLIKSTPIVQKSDVSGNVEMAYKYDNKFFSCFCFNSEEDGLSYVISVQADSIHTVNFTEQGLLKNRIK